MKSIVKFIGICIFVFNFISLQICFAEVIFHDNFDTHPDWELQQPLGGTNALQAYNGEASIPTGYHSYRISGSYFSDPGNNSIIINSVNARNGSGKSITFWNESNDRGDGWASDNQLGIYFPKGYSEVYVRFYIRFQEGWQWNSTQAYEKIFRMTHYHGGSPYVFFSDGNQHPIAGAHIARYTSSSNNCMEFVFRYENIYYPDQAEPSRKRNHTEYVGDGSYGGGGDNLIADSNWHCWEFFFKMNSAVGVPDGIFKFWHDGILETDITDFAWSDHGSQENPRLNWNYLTIGGNTFNHYALNSAEEEQYYQIDDLVVSTEPIGMDSVSTFSYHYSTHQSYNYK